jgi:hypothetical protein
MANLKREDDAGEFRENIASEVEDQESSPATFDIVTYPADFTLEGLYTKISKGEIVIPGFQRKFVWNQKQSSKLIESFLLGLPVPPIYLFAQKGAHLVIDGQQRLKSIAFFFNGVYGDPAGPDDPHAKNPTFRLALDNKSHYKGKTYADLQSQDPESFSRLNNSVLRSFVIKQLKPKGDTSIYHVFERLNTGGTPLAGQEIRNCIYHGNFNDLLLRLNYPPEKGPRLSPEWRSNIKKWRGILGKPRVDARQRDVELILRFFALYDRIGHYEKPMKDFLNVYMESMDNADEKSLSEHRLLFQKTVDCVYDNLGERPFHIRAGLNAAVYDSVFLAFASNLKRVPSDIKRRFKRLLKNENYVRYVTAATTDERVIPKRVAIAKKILFRK